MLGGDRDASWYVRHGISFDLPSARGTLALPWHRLFLSGPAMYSHRKRRDESRLEPSISGHLRLPRGDQTALLPHELGHVPAGHANVDPPSLTGAAPNISYRATWHSCGTSDSALRVSGCPRGVKSVAGPPSGKRRQEVCNPSKPTSTEHRYQLLYRIPVVDAFFRSPYLRRYEAET